MRQIPYTPLLSNVRLDSQATYKYFKENLGFNQHKVRGHLSIEGYLLLCFLVHSFLGIFRVSKDKLSFKTIGGTIHYDKNINAKKLVNFIYYQARQSAPLQSIYD